LQVGSCHGGDKFSQFNIETCDPGWGTYKPSKKARRKKEIWIENPGIGLQDCVAHLQISVLSTQVTSKISISFSHSKTCYEFLKNRISEIQICIWKHPQVCVKMYGHAFQFFFLINEIEHKHAVMTCSIDHAFVKKKYWSGKQFIQQDPSLPPYHFRLSVSNLLM